MMGDRLEQAQAAKPQQQPAEASDRREAWRVEPAPDGRGEQPAKPPMIPRSRALLAFFAGLLALNLLLSFLTGAPPDRPRVPYQPFFLEQVEAGNVEAITSREDSIEGELKKPDDVRPTGRRQARRGRPVQDAGSGVHRSHRADEGADGARRSSSTPERRMRAAAFC